jgi:hypothetical protein
LWDAATGSELQTFQHSGISAVAFSPVGGFLATGGWDGVVHIWDLSLGRRVVDQERLLPTAWKAARGGRPSKTDLVALADWYRLLGVPDRAVELYNAAGPDPDQEVRVARALCAWEAGDSVAAHREFVRERASAPPDKKALLAYLDLCVDATATKDPAAR